MREKMKKQKNTNTQPNEMQIFKPKQTLITKRDAK